MKLKRIKLSNWFLKYNGQDIPVEVPGDVHTDLFKAGITKDPYFGLNHLEQEWVSKTDFNYFYKLDIAEEDLTQETITLIFKGIDTFADIYVNNKQVGRCDNMFRKFSFQIKEFLNLGENIITVKMRNVYDEMEKYEIGNYLASFGKKRIFIRKAQCHFGWDWAPDIPGYGIWDDVFVEFSNSERIGNVQVLTDLDGNIIVNTTMNIKKKDWNCYLRYSYGLVPFAKPKLYASQIVNGEKNFICAQIKNPKLWWPKEFGDQPLYNLKVELVKEDEVIDTVETRFAFRKIELKQKPIGQNSLSFEFYINSTPLFIKGANWVPADCFSGNIRRETYEKLIDLAIEGNFNMLRVWGGGIYEKDDFYDLCDERGILIWHDMMFANADIPEQIPEFVTNVRKETEYQVTRLRNHPSLAYWCGSNEKTGIYGDLLVYGDFLIHEIIRGIVARRDPERTYIGNSPYSWLDVGNNIHSGDSHHNSFERALNGDITKYRDYVAEDIPVFVSEAAILGPNSVETISKIFPKDKLWPTNEYWEDRLMTNPYSPNGLTFTQRELKYADVLYGGAHSLEEFTFKAMLAHAETIKAELEFLRSNKGKSFGFMSWMYNDIWPSGTWAVVDYYAEPKQAYYQLKRSFAPKLVTFVFDGKNTNLVIVNDTDNTFATTIRFGKKTFDGKVLETREVKVNVLKQGCKKIPLDFVVDNDIYLYATYVDNKEEKTTLYSHDLWAHKTFESDVKCEILSQKPHEIKVKVTANKFAKSVFLHFKDNYKYIYSDNYLDIEKDHSRIITITSEAKINPNDLIINDFANY